MHTVYYNKVSKNTLLGLCATGISVLLTAVIMPMIVVRFGSDSWARYSFFLLYVAILAFIESSLQIYASQLTAAARATESNYFWMSDIKIIFAILGVLIIAGFIIGFSMSHKIMHDTNLNYMFALAFVNVLPRTISSVVKGTMQGLNSQLRYYSTTTLLNLSRPLFLFLVILLFNPQILSLVVAYVFFSFIEMMIYLLFGKESRPNIFKTTKSKVSDSKLLSSLFAANFLSVIASNLDKLLIFLFVNLTLASAYTFASTVAGLLYLFVNVAIVSFGPKFKELFLIDDKVTITKYIYGISFINNTLVMLGIVAFYFTGSGLMKPLASKLDVDTVIITFLYLSIASLLSSNLWIPGIISTSLQKASFNVKTNLLFIVAYTLSFCSIFSELDQFIFAKSMLIAAAITTTIGIIYFKLKVFDLNMSKYITLSIVVPIFFVGLITIPLWWIDKTFTSFQLNLVYIFLIGAVGIVMWLWIADELKKRFIAMVDV